ncbi:Flp pilus assembly protein CpaB [Aliishimia ponticola]|uniref:Flp pilus assembly protein CpaB n=1 Tax=Aliishimia ponticola TaxID=2499833 RepID=A0A4S4NM08_9RHOB|nr:Flp pilus assembly protein CpaB [Aliishimia ponticola]THH37240.1 Flp pilus assembly protein CpaB [Aliishimia ponticola]
MRVVFGLVLMAGLALAGGAVYMAKNYIGQYQTALAKERAAREKMVKTVPVYVAERAMKYGEELTLEDVRTVDWPENAIPEGAFNAEEDLFSRGVDTPRVVLRAMEKDEAILAVKVTEPGEDAGITSRLERGMRAFALRVDVASGVSGFLRPGDRVDVYWTGKVATGKSGQVLGDVTKLIESGVQLIAVDQTASGDLDGALVARTVTVAATPQQVASLAQAQTTGRLSLSLVGAGDDVVAEAIEVDQYRLLGIEREQEAAPEVKKAEEKVCTIRTRRGAEVVAIPIPCPD